MNSEPSERDRAEQFLALHSKNQHRISAFVHTLVADWQDAEEIFQETLMILWRKFDEFDADTDFFRWAARVAQYEVLNYRRRKKRQDVMLDAEVISALAVTAVDAGVDIESAARGIVKLLATAAGTRPSDHWASVPRGWYRTYRHRGNRPVGKPCPPNSPADPRAIT